MKRTDIRGNYEFKLALDNTLFSKDLTLELVDLRYIQSPRQINVGDIYIEENFENITLMNVISSGLGGEAASNDGVVKVIFPAGALERTTTFTVGNPFSAKINYGGSDRPAKIFDITPDTDFNKPVRIEFILAPELKMTWIFVMRLEKVFIWEPLVEIKLNYSPIYFITEEQGF